ncbi:DUF4817 domain-containing protein [Trichonephila inaurata madagascariensis]|uniref:DUF4817 domain-containing protein n=1 Tax=Trichonephila inaurata madagascariensis TaxID=2747483 RepID=A0A8X6XU81_9ARAC|nr:DUF4817 domain-containing protein [Trichonephila inaurata madagascariensis]
MIFNDESCFHKCGKVNKHNCRIWGNENPHQLCEYERDTPKVNVWLGLDTNDIIGPFFFVEKTDMRHVHLCCSANSTRFSVSARRHSTTQSRLMLSHF